VHTEIVEYNIKSFNSRAQPQPYLNRVGCLILMLSASLICCILSVTVDKEDPDKKKRSSTKSGENETNVIKAKWLLGSARERWETSLMKSTSFPQLFMHLFTLGTLFYFILKHPFTGLSPPNYLLFHPFLIDNSIEWTRSVLNARCRLCRRKGDAENMLLCDGCNKGHHAYCLKPALEV